MNNSIFNKRKKLKNLLVVILAFCGNASFGQFGLYASAVYLKIDGSSLFYNNTAPGLGQNIGTNNFQGADLGMFSQNAGTLALSGAEIKTFKSITDNVCAAELFYTVYPLGNRPVSPVFQNIVLGFYSDCFTPSCTSFYGSFDIAAGGGCCSERDQKWQIPGFGIAADVDLTQFPIGDYSLEIYYSFAGEDGGSGCGTTKFDNNLNAPNNYTARFTITNPAPVSFGTINIANRKTFNEIYWNTFSEYNTVRFEVERSGNATSFSSIGGIAAAGFSSVKKQYSFTDRQPISGINYYRIKMLEPDGKFQYSAIVNTKNSEIFERFIAENPSTGFIRLLNIKKNDRAILYNAFGSLICSEYPSGNEIKIPVSKLSSGVYYIKVINNNYQQVIPVVINAR